MTLDLHARKSRASSTSRPKSHAFAGDGARHQGNASTSAKVMVVSPDVGGVVRARGLAKAQQHVAGDHRQAPRTAGESEVMNVNRAMSPDILHSDRRHRVPAARLVNAAEALMANGARTSTPTSPTACCPAAPRAHHRLQAEGAC